MKKIITRIKRLALALAVVTPLVSWAAVDYTDTDYAPWSYSAGCVVWRGTQNNFHESTIADVAADGTVGEAYTLSTSGHPWQVFASNQSAYTSPGLTLVFDASGYKADPDATFTPLSFGGLKVDALADETEGTPYSINGSSTAARYTDFGRTDVDTYFEFNKSFTVNRSSATRCYGAVTIQVAQDATFKSQASLWAEVGGTVKLTGEGTVELPSGLYVNNNSTSTLDLSAATRPTITGNVTIYEGGAIALPAGTEPSEETPFTVCSGTLTVSTYNYVKIGDADPITATLTVSGGAITGIEPYSLERTFTSDYPTVVPAGAVFTFQGGTEDEPVVLDARTVNGTLKTEGYFSFTSYAASASSTLEVVSGKVTLDPGINWFRGTLTIDAGAEFVNASTDAVQYGGTFTANVHGTLNMGSTRWSLGANNTINLYEGCAVTGSGQGSNGALDWIENITGTLNVTGPVTIDAPIRIRSGATVNVTVDSGANEGLTLGTTIGIGKIVKKGAGLIKFTTNPSYAITCQNGAFIFDVNATPTITYTAKPSNSTSMWYAQQSTWRGTVVIGDLNAPAALPLNNWGNENSKIVLTGTTGNCYLNGTTTVAAELVVGTNENSVVEFNNGNSDQVGTFSKVSGPGTLKLVGWSGCRAATYVLNTIDNFEGLAVANNITRSGGGTFTVRIGNILTTSSTDPGDCVLPIVNTAAENATGTVVYNLANAQVNGNTLDLEAKSDGIYVVVPTVSITVPNVENATVAVSDGTTTYTPTTEGGTTYSVPAGATITVTYTSDGYEVTGGTFEFTASEGYTVDTTEVVTKQYVASITVGETTTKYTTLQAAIDAVAQNKDIVLLANEAEGATVSREITFNVVPGEYTYGDIAAGGDYILTTTALEGKTRYSFAQAVIAVTINDVRTLYSMINASSGIEAANAGPIGTTIEILSGDPQDYVDYLPMFDLNTDTGVFTKVANPVAAVYEGVIQQQVYRTLAEAVTAATSGQTVKLLADVALTETQTLSKSVTLDLNGFNVTATDCRAFHVTAGTVAFTGTGTISTVVTPGTALADSSSVIRVGSDTAETNFTLGEGVSVTTAYCYGITYFGINKQTVVINGTVAVTGEQAAISGNGHAKYNTAAGGSDVTVNGTVSATQNYAIYNPQTGTTAINGTVSGVGGIEVKSGVVTIGATASITATGTPSYTVSNQNGTSTVGYAIASVSNASYKEQPPTVTVESGAKVTGTVIAIKENSAEQLGVVKSAVNTLTIPEGFTWGTASEGYYTLAVSSGIDPTDENSSQEVTPTEAEIEAAGSAEEAAIAAATVTVPEEAAAAGVDAATYKTYFTYSATPTATAGTYAVAITGFADEVTETADGNALAALEAATAGGTLSAEVAVKPGLYYGTAAGTDVTTLKASAGELNTTGTLDLSGVTKPSTGEAFFIKIKVGTTAFTAEE